MGRRAGVSPVCFWEFVIFGGVIGETVIINKGVSFAVVLAAVDSAEFTVLHVSRVEKSLEGAGAVCAVVRYEQVARGRKGNE